LTVAVKVLVPVRPEERASCLRALLGVPIKYGEDHYRGPVRAWREHRRVGALSFVPQALVMPVTYGLLTPLALTTFDAGSCQTRSHGGGGPTGRVRRAATISGHV
jgi:hypothetical protein